MAVSVSAVPMVAVVFPGASVNEAGGPGLIFSVALPLLDRKLPPVSK